MILQFDGSDVSIRPFRDDFRPRDAKWVEDGSRFRVNFREAKTTSSRSTLPGESIDSENAAPPRKTQYSGNQEIVSCRGCIDYKESTNWIKFRMRYSWGGRRARASRDAIQGMPKTDRRGMSNVRIQIADRMRGGIFHMRRRGIGPAALPNRYRSKERRFWNTRRR